MMNTFLNYKQTPVAVLLLAGLFGFSTLAAQDSLNRSDLPRPSEDRSSCQDVEWNDSLLSDNPWVMNSCHEVIMVDGQEWARFEATFERMNRDGTIDVDFLDRRGSSQGIVSLRPGTNQTVLLNDREFAFSELRDDQRLNFYVPEGASEFAVEPGDTEMVEVVDSRRSGAGSDRFAQTEPRSGRNQERDQNRDQNRRSGTLPATAGPLPLYALGGLFAMMGGLGMTMRRRRNGGSKY